MGKFFLVHGLDSDSYGPILSLVKAYVCYWGIPGGVLNPSHLDNLGSPTLVTLHPLWRCSRACEIHFLFCKPANQARCSLPWNKENPCGRREGGFLCLLHCASQKASQILLSVGAERPSAGGSHTWLPSEWLHVRCSPSNGASDFSFMLERVFVSHLTGRRPSVYYRNF